MAGCLSASAHAYIRGCAFRFGGRDLHIHASINTTQMSTGISSRILHMQLHTGLHTCLLSTLLHYTQMNTQVYVQVFTNIQTHVCTHAYTQMVLSYTGCACRARGCDLHAHIGGRRHCYCRAGNRDCLEHVATPWNAPSNGPFDHPFDHAFDHAFDHPSTTVSDGPCDEDSSCSHEHQEMMAPSSAGTKQC